MAAPADTLQEAIEKAFSDAKGWSSEAAKEEYLRTIMDDDYIHPLFAETAEEVEKSGMGEAFNALVYEDRAPSEIASEFKSKGNKSFALGKKSAVGNIQYYRDAINHYYEAAAWAKKVDFEKEEKVEEFASQEELQKFQSVVLSNAAMAHLQLKNWGHARDSAKKALGHDSGNAKAAYRLAVSHKHLQDFEMAGDAIEAGLVAEPENKDILRLQKQLREKISKARLRRQKRERERALRFKSVKEVWRHAKVSGIRLGRLSLAGPDEEGGSSRCPHSGSLPKLCNGQWAWPCLFLYPSHDRSDFIQGFAETDVLAQHMARVLPELEEEGEETRFDWDEGNEYVCSNLAVYCEVHDAGRGIPHPDCVELLKDQASALRFYETGRALMGDEGDEISDVARCVEKKRYGKAKKNWEELHGSVWCKPDPCQVLRVHPAVTLAQVLMDANMVVPNFLVTFMLFPLNHPAHEKFLKERKCHHVVQPLQVLE